MASFSVVDDDGWVQMTGKPPSALRTLCDLRGITAQNVRAAIRDLERFAIVRRKRNYCPGYHGTTLALQVDIAGLNIVGGCEVCGAPAKGTGRWCARCKQVEGRDDRAWQVKALELYDAGVSPTRIAVRLQRPMYVAPLADDGREMRGGAVVPFLLFKGRLGDEWARRLKEAQRGTVEEQ
jgi:hypothetical protein